jgi:hypothetical protein
MTNLRDWQKKASERSDTGYKKLVLDERWEWAIYDAGYNSRDAEIDLLLQIIEKQSATLGFYANGGNFNYDLWIDKETGGHFTGKLARNTQAEVQGLVEKLVKE